MSRKGLEMSLSHSELKQLLHYDLDTGEWTRLSDLSRADRLHKQSGYFRVRIGRKEYRAHRLAYFYMTGEWPPKTIDHADLDRSNNRWNNIRPATQGQNNANSKLRKTNLSGYKGVTWAWKTGLWKAQISLQGRTIHLGTTKTAFEAHLLYVAAAKKYYGEFARAQ
jgi:HNH endonuclease/AP2 domain